MEEVSPFLYSPFSLNGPEVPTFSVFDHSAANDGQVIDYEGNDVGDNVGPFFGHDGSTGYNFAVGLGTDILAAADGKVIWVGNSYRIRCSSGTVVTDNLAVAIEHEVKDEKGNVVQRFATVYRRLKSVADAVAVDRPIGTCQRQWDTLRD